MCVTIVCVCIRTCVTVCLWVYALCGCMRVCAHVHVHSACVLVCAHACMGICGCVCAHVHVHSVCLVHTGVGVCIRRVQNNFLPYVIF